MKVNLINRNTVDLSLGIGDRSKTSFVVSGRLQEYQNCRAGQKSAEHPYTYTHHASARGRGVPVTVRMVVVVVVVRVPVAVRMSVVVVVVRVSVTVRMVVVVNGRASVRDCA